MLAKELNSLFPSTRSFAASPAANAPHEVIEPTGTHFVLQVTVLLLLTFCCYGVQVLAAAQGRADEERNEFLVRGEQLRSAGRLAADERVQGSDGNRHGIRSSRRVVRAPIARG